MGLVRNPGWFGFVWILVFGFGFLIQAQTETKAQFSELDQMILENCKIQSATSACEAKMKAVAEGLAASELVGEAPKLEIDTKLELTIVNSPTQMIENYYCLAVYNGLIQSSNFEPDIFAYAVRGFSYSKKSLAEFTGWLKGPDSASCRKILKGLGLEPKVQQIKNVYNVVLNPVAFLEFGAEGDFRAIAVNTYNHERLHAWYADSKFKAKVRKLWNRLSGAEQEEFKKEHPGYNYLNADVTHREFFSYSFEQQPQKAGELLAGKFDKINLYQLQQELCLFCVKENLEVRQEVQQLAQMKPEELLRKIESEKVKVIILASNRKASASLFSWGKVRTDPGVLNQISKIEGAMGKTLCAGEKPESKDGIAIVLAADSPYSTLLHEYLHVLQIQKDPTWCVTSKQLWTRTKVTQLELRMIRDREWDVRRILWELIKTPNMNIEDRLLITDGLFSEIEARKFFDSEALKFSDKNKIKDLRGELIKEYTDELKSK